MEDVSWAPVPSAPEYEASTNGDIRSLLQTPPLVMRQQTVKGYRKVTIRRKLVSVHRVVLEAFVGPCPDGAQGCHNNGDPLDNRLSNLRWDTIHANHADKLTHGTVARGETCARSKLITADVVEIRRLAAAGLSHTSIAPMFGLKQANVSAIVRRDTWKHV